ncbi:MAG: hypothetical protein JXO48_03920 [Deltaproteobacteria bacterium]|nr:hypothetical protein [Deltaproteobacteria bacterium]
MEQESREKTGYDVLMNAWLKMAGEFWKMAPRTGTESNDTYGMPESAEEKGEGGVRESLESTLRLWTTLATMMSEPAAVDPVMKATSVAPEIMMKIMTSTWEGYLRAQDQWFRKLGKIGEQTEAYTFENLDQNINRIWSDLYREEISPFLRVPQLGLTRFYQERLGLAIDRYNVFQSKLGEFLRLLYLPMEKSARVMEQQVEKLTREGKLPDTSQDYYRMWIKILEGHYMTLFKSHEYAQALKETLDTLDDFLLARRDSLQDILQTLPVPTERDMDDLYQEIYALKKKIRELEKNNKK